MSQRGSGQAPRPADNGLGRRYGLGRGGERNPTGHGGDATNGGSRPPVYGAFEDELDPRELDRYLEDRARLASSSAGRSSSSGVTDDDRSGQSSPSRWSSPARRRRRDSESPPRDELPSDVVAPPRPAPADPLPDPFAADAEPAPWRDADFEDDLDPWADEGNAEDVPPRYQPPRGRRRSARPRPTVVLPTVHVPRSVAQADLLHDPIALVLLGAATLLAFVMALVTLTRVGDLPPLLVLREDAYGSPARWGPPTSLWQLPLLVTMVTLMNLVLAVALSRYDRFASRFLLAAAVVVGIVTWVPAAHFLW
jgi:hypothetical protein